VEALGLTRYAIYLHDYGSQFGFRVAMAAPERVAALIVQNGDIYADEEGFRDEFVGELPDRLAERVSPDLWKLHWSLMRHPPRPEIVVGIFEDQANTLELFPEIQAYLRTHAPPTLIVWGPHDGYMPEGSARAYLRDLPDAELHLLDLETREPAR
jgi:pimeloyl-ACP methyl ester carboxylesterase